MLAVQLTSKKDFMNKLLVEGVFDNFLLQEATITSGASYVIDGHINRDFYTEEEQEELGIKGYPMLPFSMLRTNCFDLIKGNKTPGAFKFIFLLNPENLAKTLESTQTGFTPKDVTGVFLNIRFQNQMLTLTTGVSYRTFTIDKSLESAWDAMVQKFLNQHEIAFEEL